MRSLSFPSPLPFFSSPVHLNKIELRFHTYYNDTMRNLEKRKGEKTMMKKRKPFNCHTTIFFVCLLLFFTSVFVIFSVQHRRLNAQFEQLISDNLSAYTLGQKRQADGIISDLQNLLTSMAAMIRTTDLSPDDPWLDSYLDELNNESDLYHVDYVTGTQLEEGAFSYENGTGDQEEFEALLSGKGVVSNIRFSERMGGRFIFAVAEPVFKDERVVGALRARMDASMLSSSYQASGMFQKMSSLLVKGDGTIAYSDTTGYESDGNLFSSLIKNGISKETVSDIQNLYQNKDDMTYRFSGNGLEFYIASRPLRYHDWHLVKFVRSPDILLSSGLIIKSVVLTGMLLIGLTVLLCAAIIMLLLRQKQKLSMEQRRYTELSQFSDTILFEYDYAADILEFTSNASSVFGPDALRQCGVSEPGRVLTLLHPDDRHSINEILHNPSPEAACISSAESRLKVRDGSYRWFGCQYKYLPAPSGRPAKVIGKLVDISSQRGREQSLLKRATQDVLTGLCNKSGEQMIEDLLSSDRHGIFFMIDLDNFKLVNDTCGHLAGDALLAEIGAILKDLFRSEDVLARIGGDEFAAFLPGVSDSEIAERKAQQILERIHRLGAEQEIYSAVSASIGIAICPDDGISYSELYQAADLAMYSRKQAGKGGYIFASGKTWD